MAKKLSLLILSIILVLVILSTTTYALFFKQDKLVNTEEYTSGILDVVLDNDEEGLGEVLSLTNSIPIEDSIGITTTPYTFKITNKGNVSYSFDLKIIPTTVGNEIDNKYIKVMIDEDEPIKLSNIDNNIVKSNILIAPQDSITISVRIWLDDSMPNTEIGKSFSAKMVTDGVAIEEPKIASEYLMRLSKGEGWESGAEGLYELTYTKEDGTSLMLSDTKTTTYSTDKEDRVVRDYRYVGSEPHNYVWFNDDMYQIIGIFDENTHGIEGEYLVKLISVNEMAANAWGAVNTTATSGVYSNVYNDWTGKQYETPASANILLNEYFLNRISTSTTYGACSDWTYFYTLSGFRTNDCQTMVGYGIKDEYRDYIETVMWHLNGPSTNELDKKSFYLCERGMYDGCTSANNGQADTSVNAKIGLMYPSDYMYASRNQASDSTLSGNSYYHAINSWIFKGLDWTITSCSDDSKGSFYVHAYGKIEFNRDVAIHQFSLHPTMYLKSSVKIIGGNGTFENPFVLEL